MGSFRNKLRAMDPERRHYAVNSFVEHQAASGNIDRLYQHLLNEEFSESDSLEYPENASYVLHEDYGTVDAWTGQIKRIQDVLASKSDQAFRVLVPALLQCSVGSLAQSLDLEQIDSFATADIVSYERAFEMILLIPDEQQRVASLIQLAGQVDLDLTKQRSLLEAATAISHPQHRCDALIGIIPYVPGVISNVSGVIESIYAEVQRFPVDLTGYNSSLRTTGLRAIGAYLPLALVEHALNEIAAEQRMLPGLTTLIPRLAELGHQHRALELIEIVLFSDQDREQTLIGIIPHLDSSLLNRLIAKEGRVWIHLLSRQHRAANSLEEDGDRGLVTLIARLLELGNLELALEWCAYFSNPFNCWMRLSDLRDTCPQLWNDELETIHSGSLSEALTTVRQFNIENEQRSRAFCAMARYLTGSKQQRVLAEAIECVAYPRNPQVRQLRMLKELAGVVPEALHESLLAAIERFPNDTHRAERIEILEILAPRLTRRLHAQALALVPGKASRAKVIAALAAQLSVKEMQQELSKLAGMRWPWMDWVQRKERDIAIASLVSGFAPYAAGSVQTRIFQLASSIEDPAEKLRATLALVEHTSGAIRNQLIETVKPLIEVQTKHEVKAQAWLRLALAIPVEMRHQAKTRLIRTSQAINDEHIWIETLLALFPYASEAVQRALLDPLTEAARPLLAIGPDESARVPGLSAILPALLRYGREKQALEMARKTRDPIMRSLLLKTVAIAYGEQDEPRKAFRLAREIEPTHLRVEVYNKLLLIAPRAWHKQLQTARSAAITELATEIEAGHNLGTYYYGITIEKWTILLATAPDVAMRVFERFPLRESISEAWIAIIPLLPYRLLPLAVERFRDLRINPYDESASLAKIRDQCLTELAVRLSESDWQQATDAVDAISDTDRRNVARARLLASVDPDKFEEVLYKTIDDVFNIQDRELRLEGLVALSAVISGSREISLWSEIRELVNPNLESCEALARLAYSFTDDRAAEVAAFVFDLIHENMWRPSVRAEALARIAPFLRGEYQAQALWKALRWGAVINTEYSHERYMIRQAMAPLIDRLFNLPVDTLLAIWPMIAQDLATLHRSHALLLIGRMAPVVAKLAGTDGVNEVFFAIQDIGRWWPSQPWDSTGNFQESVDALRQSRWRANVMR